MEQCQGSLEKMESIEYDQFIKYVKDTGKGLMYLHPRNFNSFRYCR